MDTNVLISALFWNGNERNVLENCMRKRYVSVTSPQILKEVATVLSVKFSMGKAKVEAFIGYLCMISHIVFLTDRLTVIIDDPSDNIILETAVIGRCDLIISGDRHLLDLDTYQGILIRSAGKIIDNIKSHI
jgi:putative PIN family toxin of toxin-antitoxin system